MRPEQICQATRVFRRSADQICWATRELHKSAWFDAIKIFVPLAMSFWDVIICSKILVYYLATHYLEFQTGRLLNLCLLYAAEIYS